MKYCCLLDPQFVHGKSLNATEKIEGREFLVSEAMRSVGADIYSTSFDEDSDEEENFINDLFGRKRRSPHPQVQNGLSLRAKVEAEVNRYYDRFHQKAQENTCQKQKSKTQKLDDGLKWWRENGSDFPLLAPIARKYFGMVATSVPSERCFSWAGNIITARRNRLSSSNLRDLIFLYSNTIGEEPEE